MEPINQQAREAQRKQANREELVERIARATSEDGSVEPLKGLCFYRFSSPEKFSYGVHDPALCVIAQGSKEVLLGDKRYRCDSSHYLLATAELPIVTHVLEASREQPYLSLRLNFDAALIGSAIAEAALPPLDGRVNVRAMGTSLLDAHLLDAVVRLVRLVDTPSEAAVIAPLVMREIVYRLLIGEQGSRLRYIALLGGRNHRIIQAVERLCSEFDQPLRIDSIAREVGMSISGFHSHFKAITALSPLQFQKQVRLQEARRLMLVESLDAASAGYQVGYDDASHFSREYKSLFGLSPMRDAERLRAAVMASNG